MPRTPVLSTRVSYLYACALVTVHFLYLPFGGYERMMEGKYFCYLALTLGYFAACAWVSPRPRLRRGTRMDALAAAYLFFTALSALCSPFGAATLLGGPRRDALASIALYVLSFFLLSRTLHPDRRLVCLLSCAAALCALLTLAQLAGHNPLWLYPEGLNYFDGDVEYAGFFAGTAGNADFTAFLLALSCAVLFTSALRRRMWAPGAAAAAALCSLAGLSVATAWAGLGFAAVWGLALLFPHKKGMMALYSALLTLLAAALIWHCTGGTLGEASRLLHGEWNGAFGSGRLAIWRDCLPLVRERPLLGGGPDTLWLRGLEPFAWRRGDALVPSDITAAHNEYLGILVNQGAMALLVYLALLGTALARCFHRADDPALAACGMGLLCYAAMAFFSISTPITAPYVWLLLAIVHKDEIDS